MRLLWWSADLRTTSVTLIRRLFRARCPVQGVACVENQVNYHRPCAIANGDVASPLCSARLVLDQCRAGKWNYSAWMCGGNRRWAHELKRGRTRPNRSLQLGTEWLVVDSTRK